MTAGLRRVFSRTTDPASSEAPLRTFALLATLTAVLTGALTGPAAAAPKPREVNQGYSIPVGAVTDLGALPVLGSLGLDFARLLGA
ncbi:hypothetical protein ACFP3U_16005 [Kitasatospora misakiensis]|uniref:Uncharacterized protein n=1 Tax=Kitasatospora misakiensis TaxID=67330 RepID=A0ABW0X5T2_9ACTN